MTSDDQILLSEDQLWPTVGDSLVARSLLTKNQKRARSPSFEYVRPPYKRKVYIRQTNNVPDSTFNPEPRSLAGHVKRREGQRVIVLPPPTSKSSAPSGVSQGGGGGTEEGQGGDEVRRNEEDEGDDGSEDNDGENGSGDEEGARVELEEGSSDDEFESATSTPWPEGVGISDPPENPYSIDRLRPTPNSVLDATTAQLEALKIIRERAELETYRSERKTKDLDGPGWKLFDMDIRGLGIEVYHLYSEGGQVWRYKGHNSGRGERVSEPHHRVEIPAGELERAGWVQELGTGEWARHPTAEEEGEHPFATNPAISRLPLSLRGISYEIQEARASEILFLDPRGLGGPS